MGKPRHELAFAESGWVRWADGASTPHWGHRSHFLAHRIVTSERRAVHDTKIIPLQEEWKKLRLALGSQKPELDHWGTRQWWPSQCVPKKFTNAFIQTVSGSAQTWCFFLVMKLGSGEDQETFAVGKGCTAAELH